MSSAKSRPDCRGTKVLSNAYGMERIQTLKCDSRIYTVLVFLNSSEYGVFGDYLQQRILYIDWL